MDYKLNNGFVLKITKEGEAISNTYLRIEATGYHGDMDYYVNNETKIHFNDSKREFKRLISFICFVEAKEFCDLKEDCQKLFTNKEDFNDMIENWEDFCSDHSETHDKTISLKTDYWYVIEGKRYNFNDIELDILKPCNYN